MSLGEALKKQNQHNNDLAEPWLLHWQHYNEHQSNVKWKPDNKKKQ